MSKIFMFSFVAGIVLLIIGASASSRIQQSSSEKTEAQRELNLYKQEVVDATPTQLGVLTERQKIHSKLYSFYGGRNKKKLSEFISHPEGKVIAFDFEIGLGPKLTTLVTNEEYFGRLADESDAIISGRANQKVSQITEDDTFIFTDYHIEVIEVFKDNPISPLANGVNITLTRPGGKIVVDGVIMQATDHHFLPLPVNTKEVFLFLKYIPQTGAYQATRDTGSFQLDDETLRPLTEAHFPPGVVWNRNSFLQTVRGMQNK